MCVLANVLSALSATRQQALLKKYEAVIGRIHNWVGVPLELLTQLIIGLGDDFLRSHKADSLLATTLRAYEAELFTVRKRAEAYKNREKHDKSSGSNKKDKVQFNVLLGWNQVAGRPISFDRDVEIRLRKLRGVDSYDDLKSTFHEQKEYTAVDNSEGGNGGKRTVQVLEFQGGHAKRRRNNEVNRPSPPRYVADKRASSF